MKRRGDSTVINEGYVVGETNGQVLDYAKHSALSLLESHGVGEMALSL